MNKITRDEIDTYVANIVATWNAATPEQLAAGREWYAEARQIAAGIGNGNVRTGAGIIAALSPMTQWSLNVRNAAALAAGEPVGTLGNSLIKARRILSGEDFSEVLTAGSKTWSFAHNIVSDSDHVTVDRWAIRVAAGYDKSTVTTKQYEVLADAYRKAAAEIGELASVVQAVTWCVIRGSGR